jgi:hypothetical protein
MFLCRIFWRVDGGEEFDPVAHRYIGLRFEIILADPGAVLGCALTVYVLDADRKKQQKKKLSHGLSVNFSSANQFIAKSANRGGFFYE